MTKYYLSKTNLFSRNAVKVVLSIPYSLYDDTMLSFLKKILTASTLTYPTTKQYITRQEELYNTHLFASSTVNGNQLSLSFTLNYLKAKRLNLESSAIDLLIDAIFNPHIVNGKWNQLDFDEAINITKFQIDTFKDEPEEYAYYQGMKLFDLKSPLAYPGFGDEVTFKTITPGSIANYYHEFINKAEASVYLVGAFSDQIQAKIEPIIEHLNIKNPQYVVYESNSNIVDEQFQIEPAKLTQSKIVIGFKANNLTSFESKYVLAIYNYILGGGTFTSKIHHEIREKRGLAYFAASVSKKSFNAIIARTAVDQDKVDLAVSLIKNCHQEMIDGDFSKSEVKKAITFFINNVKNFNTNINTYVEDFISVINQENDLPKERALNFKKVTKNDVVKLASKISLASIYVLGGNKK